MSTVDTARERISWAAQTLARLKRAYLEELKSEYAGLQRDDFLWHYLLQSFATMGGESGWNGLIGNDANYRQVTFEALNAMADADRQTNVLAVCNQAGIRYPQRKAKYIVGCYDKISIAAGNLIA